MAVNHGILLAAGSGSRLWPLTSYINKHLCVVYDKPLIYYPLTNLILAGCKSISIVVNANDFESYSRLVEYLRGLNIDADLVVQPSSAKGIPSAIRCGLRKSDVDQFFVVLGDNVLISRGFISQNIHAGLATGNMKIFTHPVNTPDRFGIVERDANGGVTKIIEKPTHSHSNEAIIGAYILPAGSLDFMDDLQQSARGETEVVDIIEHFYKRGALDIEQLTEGSLWLDAGTTEDLALASNFIDMMQRASGKLLGSVEIAAVKRGLVSPAKVINHTSCVGNSAYKSKLLTALRNFS